MAHAHEQFALAEALEYTDSEEGTSHLFQRDVFERQRVDSFERQRVRVPANDFVLNSSEQVGHSREPGSPTKQAWLEAQRSEWAGSRRRRSVLEAQKPKEEALPALPSDSEWEEQLKRELLRNLKDEQDARLGARRRDDANITTRAAEPTDREVWLQQKRR